MKKFLAFLLVACAAFGLVACGEETTGPTLETIEISGYDDEFTVGEDFTTAGLVVTAVYSDETTENVTVDAEVDSNKVDTDVNGVYPVVITYEGKTVFYMVTVLAKEEDAELQSISVSGQKTDFTVGDEFSQGDLVVTATYTDGKKVDVTKDSTVKQNADMQTPGKYAVVVSFGDKNTIYEINVVAPEPAPTLVSISLSGYTDKFTEGGSFVTTGLVVTATYSDNSTKDVTSEAKVENNVDMNIAGQYVVIVSYEDKVAYYEVTVLAKPEAAVLKNITVSGQKTEFKVGDKFETTGLVVTANYSDGSSVDVTNAANISQNADMANAGKYAVLVSYNGQVAAYEIVVTEYENIKTLTGITVEAEEVKKLYAIGEGLDLNKLLVYEQYNNSQAEPSIEVFTDLSGYTIKVYNEDGQEVVGEFTEYGKYTVTVSKENASDSFIITVGQKVFAAVEDAVQAGYENANKVASGKATVDNTGYVTEYTYAFGTNYTFVKDAYGE